MNFFEENKDNIFRTYTDTELMKDIYNHQNKKGRCYKVLNHFFEPAILACKSHKGSCTPIEMFKDEEKMAYVNKYIKEHPKTYDSANYWVNLRSYLNIGTRYGRKVANFSVTQTRDFINSYGKNLRVFDPCAGFGARCLGAVLNGHTYTGIDINPDIEKGFNQMANWLETKEVINRGDINFIKGGCEVFRPELKNQFDITITITSPPYFNIERYANDNGASTRNYDNYGKWFNEFIVPMCDNTIRYLKVGGVFAINLKNLTKYKLFDDTFDYLKSLDCVECLGIEDFKVGAKYFYKNTTYNKEQYKGYKEPIMIFKKIKD